MLLNPLFDGPRPPSRSKHAPIIAAATSVGADARRSSPHPPAEHNSPCHVALTDARSQRLTMSYSQRETIRVKLRARLEAAAFARQGCARHRDARNLGSKFCSVCFLVVPGPSDQPFQPSARSGRS